MATLNQDIIAMMRGLGFPQADIVPSLYLGESSEYIVFNYDVRPISWGDDTAGDVDFFIQIHYICQWAKNTYSKRADIRRAIEETFGDYPSETDASDGTAQHYVFEFDIVEDAHYGESS